MTSDSVFSSKSSGIDVLVLAAGFGSRLRPITDDMPKALVPLSDGSCLLDYTLSCIRQIEFVSLNINLHYMAQKIVQHCAGYNFVHRDLALNFLYEDKILHTAGAIKNAFESIGCKELLVHNVDTLFFGENFLHDFIASYSKDCAADSYLAIYPKSADSSDQQGDFSIQDDKLVVQKGGDYIFTGVAIHKQKAFLDYSEKVFDLLDILTLKNHKIGFYIVDCDKTTWIDAGDHDRLEKANKMISKAHGSSSSSDSKAAAQDL